MRAGWERLAPVDEANIILDHAGQVNVFLVVLRLAPGGFVAPDGRADLDRLRATLGERVASLPALNKALVAATRGHGWVSATPDLTHHVREVLAVDGMPGLERLCGALMTTPLEIKRPLWEILLVPAVQPGRAAIVLRIHHAVADGMAAVTIVRKLLDPTPPSVPAHPAAPPPTRRTRLKQLTSGLRRIRATLLARGVGATALLGPRSDHRGVVFLDAELAPLEQRMPSERATVNDALLAAVAAGFRAALIAAGEQIPRTLPVSVPVALERRGRAANQVGVMLVDLPTGTADADERLRAIAIRTRAEKSLARGQGTLEFMRGPIGARIMDRVTRRQHLVAGFVTNVRGPTGPQQLAGAPVERMWPVAVIAANVRLGVAALSGAGHLGCAVHFDADHVPGVEFARAMRCELDRLTHMSPEQ